MPSTAVSHGSRIALLLMTVVSAVAVLAAGPASARQLTDIAVADAVADQLRQDPHIVSHAIDVQTDNGTVTLTGTVDTIQARQRATRVAETVKGVRAVVNTIEVAPGIEKTDSQIRQDVRDALKTDPATAGTEIAVDVNNGRVTLSGTVDSWQQKQLVTSVAMGVGGVVDLTDDIAVVLGDTRGDDEIRQDVTAALRWDVLVDHALIDVSVADAAVTLSGVVGSAAEKRRAVENARVANVSTVDAQALEVRRWARDPDLRGDKYKNLSTDRILEAVNDALSADARVATQGVTAKIDDGVVTLRGQVDSVKSKDAAAAAARRTVGVDRVVNRIKVRPPAPVSDEKLADRVRRAFERDSTLAGTRIDIQVRNGVVDLFGQLESYAKQNTAQDLASRIDGVVAVNSYLVVTGSYDPYPYDPYLDDWGYTGSFPHYYVPPQATLKTDRQIKADLEEELFWSPFVEGDEIDIRVENGVATLYGTVDSWAEFNTVTNNAFEAGATRVDNNLIVY